MATPGFAACTSSTFRFRELERSERGLETYIECFRIRYYRGRVSNFDQSESRKHCFLASDRLKFVTLPR